MEVISRAQFRSRRKFTSPGQKKLLEFVYRVYPKPSKDFQRYLADLLGMETKRVRVWFQNKRTRGSATEDQLLTSEKDVHAKMRAEIGDLLLEFESARAQKLEMRSHRLPILPLREKGVTYGTLTTIRATGRLGTGHVSPHSNTMRSDIHQPLGIHVQLPDQALPASPPRPTHPRSQSRTGGQHIALVPSAGAVDPNFKLDFTQLNRIVVAVISGNPAQLKEVLQSIAPVAVNYLNYGDQRVNVLNSATSISSFPSYLAIMRLLLEHGLDPYLPAHSNALHYAARLRAHTALSFLLQNGTPASKRDSSYNSPLHVCATLGDVGGARLLLEHDAQVDARNAKSETPLHCAILGGHFEVADVLIKANADVDCRTVSGDSCLHLAFRHGKISLARMMLKRTSNLDVINTSLDSPLHELVASPLSVDEKLSLLYAACQSMASRTDVVKKVLQLRNSAGETLLHVACIVGNVKLTEALLQYGFDPAAVTFQGSGKRSAGLNAVGIAKELGWTAVEEAIKAFLSSNE